MTTEQIIKGLEESIRIAEAYYDRLNIPKEMRPSENKKALALIKELLAENAGLKTALETLQGVAKDYEHHNENLKRENKYLRERLAEEMEHKEDMSVEFTCVFGQPHKVSDCPITEEIDKAKADTVKKMQEKLIAAFCPDADYCGYDIHAAINAKAKEVLNEPQ